MPTGVIKRVFADKKFGFITGDDRIDRFFHADSLRPGVDIGDLRERQRVEFVDGEDTGKGPRADDVNTL